MGIKGLYGFLRTNAPGCIREKSVKSFTGRKIAVDASMSLYAFLVAIRSGDHVLTNEAGEDTSHIAGMFSRIVRLLESNITPVLVFDGAAPDMKSGELDKRREAKEKAEGDLKEAVEAGDQEMITKLSKRTVRVTKKHNDDVKKLLELMGIWFVNAPGEAEAQCAKMTADGTCYGVATEDADALTFGCTRICRNLVTSEAKQKIYPPQEVVLDIALEQLELTMDQFIDFCILCGSDYTSTIRGIGPSTAFNLIKQHKNIETVLQNIDSTKHPTPENFDYKGARNLFKEPLVYEKEEILETKKKADYEGLRKWLLEEHSFNPERVENMIKRLKKISGTAKQTRLDCFFGEAKINVRPVVKAAAKGKGKGRGSLKAKTK